VGRGEVSVLLKKEKRVEEEVEEITISHKVTYANPRNAQRHFTNKLRDPKQ
jgi:hypothetical protein